MELVTDDSGDVAPRLGDVSMSAEQALEDHAVVMHYVVLMIGGTETASTVAMCVACVGVMRKQCRLQHSYDHGSTLSE